MDMGEEEGKGTSRRTRRKRTRKTDDY